MLAAFTFIPWEFFEIDKNCFVEKCILELCWTTTIKPRQIEYPIFFYWTKTNDEQARAYRLVWGQPDVSLWRNHDFPTEDSDFEKCILKVHWTTVIKLRNRERFVFLLPNHNRETWIYRLVWTPIEVQFRRNQEFPTDDDDCAPRIIRFKWY